MVNTRAITLSTMKERALEFSNSRVAQSLLLIGITLFAMLLRLYKLGEWSFWGDELISVRRATEMVGFNLVLTQISQILIALSLRLFGTSEWSARLAPALIGVITVPVLYFLVRSIYGNSVGLLSSLFLALSSWHLYWSQNARFYTTILLFYTIALVALYHGFEKNRPWYLLLSMLFLGLAVRERMFTLVFVPIVVGYLLAIKFLRFEKPPGLHRNNLLLLIIPGVIVGLLVSWRFIQDPSQWSQTFAWVNNNPLWILSGSVFYLTIPTLAMGTVGGAYLLIKKDRAALLFSIAAVFPLLAILALSFVQYTANRYVFVSLTSWIVLAGVGVRELFAQTRGLSRILAAGTLLILVLEPLSENVLYYQYQHGNRDNWKAAFAYIEHNKEAGDRVAVFSNLHGAYYSKEKTMNINLMDFDSLGVSNQRIWFIEDMNLGEKNPRALQWILNHTELKANFDVHVRARNFKMRVYLYEPPGK